ncbi:uncharacterized protein BYT42DRAFT_544863 [Radiomyces spectabilis]|uniref:uncharacterized protein n=1 Tax=Radiomyces spectabilis TaxID=64574 RepID=UPI0022206DAA|nr:uncharacterized protein BYT42DRAFT_544863 [Radiomyces spectabilis]KAI8380888.1 hypothetical protein BYT42DRAFT_544863 [Radiomyces spectabilis]
MILLAFWFALVCSGLVWSALPCPPCPALFCSVLFWLLWSFCSALLNTTKDDAENDLWKTQRDFQLVAKPFQNITDLSLVDEQEVRRPKIGPAASDTWVSGSLVTFLTNSHTSVGYSRGWNGCFRGTRPQLTAVIFRISTRSQKSVKVESAP